MAEQWRPGHRPVDLVVPVPLHPARRRRRGYNQSALLARSLCEKMDWTLSSAALQRVRATRPQVGLDAAHRAPNVQGAFQALESGVRGQHVLLVDDVCTTGATLLAAARPLLAAGAATVSAYCLGRAA
jgi:ComF family protein